MIRSYWLRGAGIAAILASLVQMLVLSSQLQQWFLMQQPRHVTWEWAVGQNAWEWHVPWVITLPWAFALLAFIAFQVATAQQTRRLGWIGMAVAGIGVLALLTDEIGALAFPKCPPRLLCPVPPLENLVYMRNVGLGGALFVVVGLLLLSATLLHTTLPRVWGILLLLMGLLSSYMVLVVVEVVENSPGYFKVNPVTIFLGLGWAIGWLLLGLLLLVGQHARWTGFRPFAQWHVRFGTR